MVLQKGTSVRRPSALTSRENSRKGFRLLNTSDCIRFQEIAELYMQYIQLLNIYNGKNITSVESILCVQLCAFFRSHAVNIQPGFLEQAIIDFEDK